MRTRQWLRSVLRAVTLAIAVNGLVAFAFAMRWEHVSFNLDDSIALTVSSAAFVWLMGSLD